MGNANKDRWGWLRKACLKRTIEALIMAAQEQALRPNNIKANTNNVIPQFVIIVVICNSCPNL